MFLFACSALLPPFLLPVKFTIVSISFEAFAISRLMVKQRKRSIKVLLKGRIILVGTLSYPGHFRCS